MDTRKSFELCSLQTGFRDVNGIARVRRPLFGMQPFVNSACRKTRSTVTSVGDKADSRIVEAPLLSVGLPLRREYVVLL